MRSATRSGYDALRLELADWRTDLIEWRCALPPDEVARLRGRAGDWDCRDLKFFVGRIGFDDLAPEMKDRLDAIPTRLALPARDIDLVLSAAREATRANPALRGFLRSLTQIRPSGTEIAPRPGPQSGGENGALADPG